MTRRDSILAVAIAGLLAGCARHNMRESEPLPLFQVPPPATIETQPPGRGSPYHEQPMPPPPAQAVEPPRPVSTTPGAASSPPAAPETPITQTRMQYPTTHHPIGDVATSVPAIPATLSRSVDDPPIVGALRCLLDKRPADAVALLKSYEQPNQDILLSLLPLAARLSEPCNEKHLRRAEATAMADQLEQLRAKVCTQAAFVLDKPCFCKSIDRFGVYEARPEGNRFMAGCPVHVYVELRNFTSEERDCCFETRLASTIKMLDARGQVANQWGFNDRNRPECSRSLRHDYFINYSFRLPENVPPGRYELRLLVEDVPTGRSAEQTLELHVLPRAAAQ